MFQSDCCKTILAFTILFELYNCLFTCSNLNYITAYLHALFFIAAQQAMEQGRSPVIIDNTNTQAWEMKPYVEVVGFVVKSYHLLQPRTFTFTCGKLVCFVRDHFPYSSF